MSRPPLPFLLRTLLVIAATLGTVTSAAHAQPRVLVMRRAEGPDRPAFDQALRIQLVGEAELSTGPPLGGETLPDRVEEAAAAVGREDAVIGAWLESGETRGELHLFIVGRRRQRALIEVARLPADQGPDVDRTLALKVREVLDSVLASQSERADVAGALDTVGGRGRFTVALGFFAATPSGSVDHQLGASLGAHLGLPLGPLMAEAAVGMRFPTDLSASRGRVGRVSIDELSPWLDLHLHGGDGDLRVGGYAGVVLRVLMAEGVTDAGTVGTATVLAPALGLGAEGRLRLGDWLWLGLGLGGELTLHRPAFSLNRREVADVGRLRAVGQLSLVITGI
jgi:hypothetical protein